ncbi:MAG TPA: molybdate ABC transporter substrate-binding protein [Gaiellaceae bacterium]|nr:molybdate ABC transporter substrate-binding protein [Gaiellaceae bacterium]
MKSLLATALAVLALTACGGGGSPRLTVFAAASLTEVLQGLEPDARYNFAGSDELATQLREGARADVYAAASPKYPDQLADEGIVEKPKIFATNRLVIVVPSGNPARIRSLADLERKGVKLVIGAEGVPIGDYTREVLDKAGRSGVLDRVVSEEEDVKGVLGKVALGEADAGIVYVTDAKAGGSHVRAIELPAAAQATVRYPLAVVSGSKRKSEARRFVALLRGERGRQALREAGFGLP